MLRFKFLIIVSCLILLSPCVIKSEGKPELTEIQKVKAENFQLKIQLAQCGSSLADISNKYQSVILTSEQSKLVEEFRKQLNANEKDTFDWSTLTFNPPKPIPENK